MLEPRQDDLLAGLFDFSGQKDFIEDGVDLDPELLAHSTQIQHYWDLRNPSRSGSRLCSFALLLSS
jgi:hypothetical protein